MQRRGGECEALPLSAAKRIRSLFSLFMQRVLVDCCGDPIAAAFSWQRLNCSEELEVLDNREVLIEREALGHVANAGFQSLRILRYLVS